MVKETPPNDSRERDMGREKSLQYVCKLEREYGERK